MMRAPSRRQTLAAAGIVLFITGLWQLGSALFIPAKAAVAQVLLHRAWDRTLAGEDHAKPWPWADTWPVARLKLPSVDADLIVLAGASGHALAFGPGHVAGTAAPGQHGLSMIGGHRDTHMKVLAGLKPGSRVEIQRPDGKTLTYRVDAISIADARHPRAVPEDTDGLVLVTCYPFDALIPGGPLRYLVHAVPVER
jgi:sortase A